MPALNRCAKVAEVLRDGALHQGLGVSRDGCANPAPCLQTTCAPPCGCVQVPTCAGGVFFLEFSHATPASLLGFALGVAAAMLGVAILSGGGGDGGGDEDIDQLIDEEGHAMEELSSLKRRSTVVEGRAGSPSTSPSTRREANIE